MHYTIFVFLLAIPVCRSVIYRLNGTEYLKMPPINHLDDYERCLDETNGTYCYLEIRLVSDTSSDLLQMIHEYSEHTPTHFNYAQLHYGICLTGTCKRFIQNNNSVVDPILTLERCLNESLWEGYGLKARITNTVSCNKLANPIILKSEDIIAAVIFLCILVLNLIGSLYDFYIVQGRQGSRLLLSFSIKRNLGKLFTLEDHDIRREKLKGIHGLRALSIMIVILAHAPLSLVFGAANPHGLEKTYYNILFHLFYNGTLIVQTFFIITGCLLAYNIRTYSENNKLSWVLIPKGILLRWLRLTPAYAIVLIFTLTWIRFVASGPMWEVSVGVEVADCRRDGWLNMIYLNNYIDNSLCMAQTWYLAADMQLYILGLIVCILVKTSRSRKVVLSTLLAIGFLIPAAHTYLQDLDAIVLMSPESARNFFIKYPTFNESYKRGHTNIPGFVLGLALGNLIYSGLKNESIMKKYKRLGFFYYLTFPMGVAVILSGMVFYRDGPRPSIYVRVIVAAIVRPFFALLVTILFIGMVFKFENVYRRVLEWQGWRIPARVSYSAFLVHAPIIRILGGMNITLSTMGLAQCFKEAFGIIFMSFLFAYPFWLFVEAPLNEAVLIILGLSKKRKENDKLQNTENIRNQIGHGNSRDAEINKNLEINIRL